MRCYQLALLTMANLARANENNENLTCKWNAFNSGVTSFPASASEFRGKWNAHLPKCVKSNIHASFIHPHFHTQAH